MINIDVRANVPWLLPMKQMSCKLTFDRFCVGVFFIWLSLGRRIEFSVLSRNRPESFSIKVSFLRRHPFRLPFPVGTTQRKSQRAKTVSFTRLPSLPRQHGQEFLNQNRVFLWPSQSERLRRIRSRFVRNLLPIVNMYGPSRGRPKVF